MEVLVGRTCMVNHRVAEASTVRDGACVILGRCADYVLEDMPNHFSIFVCADDEYREKRGKEVYEPRFTYHGFRYVLEMCGSYLSSLV